MTKATRKRRRRSRVPEYQSYIFEIEDWAPNYSFSVNDNDRFFDGAYSEYHNLSLTGIFLAPDKAKDRRATLRVLADRRATRTFDDANRTERKPPCVGALTIRGKTTDYLGWMPHDALWGLSAALSCRAIRFLVLHGRALYHGRSDIRSMHFVREYDPEDW